MWPTIKYNTGLSLQKILRFIKAQETMSNSMSITPPAPISSGCSWYTMLSQSYTSFGGITVFEIHHTVGSEKEPECREDTQNMLGHGSLMQAPPQFTYLLNWWDLISSHFGSSLPSFSFSYLTLSSPFLPILSFWVSLVPLQSQQDSTHNCPPSV